MPSSGEIAAAKAAASTLLLGSSTLSRRFDPLHLDLLRLVALELPLELPYPKKVRGRRFQLPVDNLLLYRFRQSFEQNRLVNSFLVHARIRVLARARPRNSRAAPCSVRPLNRFAVPVFFVPGLPQLPPLPTAT